MSNLAATVQPQQPTRRLQVDVLTDRKLAILLVSGLTVIAVAAEGYHPFAEDGGLYVAGVERLLDPTLFPRWTEFVAAPMRISLFSPALAALVRLSHLHLPTVLFLIHLGAVWATLFGGWLIAEHCWTSNPARVGAVVLLACWLPLPVAGTSLQFMDPYVTARSFSTPCMVFALAAILGLTRRTGLSKETSWILLLASLGIAFAMHPLMAGYALGACSVLTAWRARTRVIRAMGAASLCISALALAVAVHASAPSEDEIYTRVALTRSYWFPAHWAWYEILGLLAPLAIVGGVALNRICWHQCSAAERALARMAALCGGTSLVIAFLFARAHSSEHLVARLQPLRIFQVVYLVMILIIGAQLGSYLLQTNHRRWCATTLLLCGIVFTAEHAAYPQSIHLELPGTTNPNEWVEAFRWVREHTPKDAVFALDPDYIHAPGQDGDCFRAIAQRSALPDYSKDGGEASIAPELGSAWQAGQSLEQPLLGHLDLSSLRALRSAGVSWMVLRTGTPVHLKCPYTNSAVQVCRIN